MRQRITPVFLLVIMTLGGCVTSDRVHSAIEGLQTGPKSAPKKTITNFSSGLHCMDDLLLEFRVSEKTFLIESLRDETGRVSGGTRDMLITALASMSRRSNAIKVIAYDADSSNAIAFMERASGPQIYRQIPMYDIRGSISQYDSRLATNRANAALNTKDWGVGGDRRVSGDVLGVDLSIARMADLSVIPAVTSSNQVIIMDSTASADGDAVIKNSGVYFNFSLDRSEGRVQAVRNLLDLAAIELIGRLTKVPYWQCLDVPNHSDAVRQEVADWMRILDRDDRLVSFVRRILFIKGYYNTQIEHPTLAFQQAVVSYQQSVGAVQDGVVDHEFMLALLKTDEDGDTGYEDANGLPQIATLVSDSSAPAREEVFDRIEISMRYSDDLEVSLNRSGYLHCYFQDADQNIQRFFPNRFSTNSFVRGDQVIRLPGTAAFSLHIDPAQNETATCFATDEPILDRLPLDLRAADFELLETRSMSAVKQAYIRSALAPVGVATYGSSVP